MRVTLLLAFILAAAYGKATAQRVLKDVANVKDDTDRIAILVALDKVIFFDLREPSQFKVSYLKIENGFAFLKGNIKNPKGGAFDFSKTIYKDMGDEFDGPNTYGFFKLEQGKWKCREYGIGQSSIAYICFWKQYSAPKEIFDYTDEESCQ